MQNNKQQRKYAVINVEKEYIPLIKMQALKQNKKVVDYIQELIRKDLNISEVDEDEKHE